MPAVEEIVITRPERCPRITGSTARVTFIGPNRLVSICARTCSGVISSKKPAKKLPALLTSTSMRPNRVDGRGRGVLGAVRVGDVERGDEQVLVLADRRRARVGVAAGGDDAWPAARAARAMSTPMPRPAPVMSQTFLSVMSCPVVSMRATVR